MSSSPLSAAEPLWVEGFGGTAMRIKQSKIIHWHIISQAASLLKPVILCAVFICFTWRQRHFLHCHIRQPPGGVFLIPYCFFLQSIQVAVVAITPHQRHHTLQQAVQQLALSLQPPDGCQVVVPLHLKFCLQVTDLQLGYFQLSQQIYVILWLDGSSYYSMVKIL